jgi:hypothetical protein
VLLNEAYFQKTVEKTRPVCRSFDFDFYIKCFRIDFIWCLEFLVPFAHSLKVKRPEKDGWSKNLRSEEKKNPIRIFVMPHKFNMIHEQRITCCTGYKNNRWVWANSNYWRFFVYIFFFFLHVNWYNKTQI